MQHNPLIADGSDALGKYFGQVTGERVNARVVVYRIIAVGDYVWAHVAQHPARQSKPHVLKMNAGNQRTARKSAAKKRSSGPTFF